MEKAILKTLIYADIFDYPLLSHEVHKWLIGKEASVEQVERSLLRLVKARKIVLREGVYFLKGRVELVKKRLVNEKVSQKYYFKAKWIGQLFKVIPWVKLVGISGSLAMRNADLEDDIDLFVITGKKRVWLTRVFSALILELLGERRQRGQSDKQSSGKICLNLLISEEALEQNKKDLYVAHEILQMKVLWERKRTYQKFLEANFWTGKFLPNWIGISAVERQLGSETSGIAYKWVDQLEKVVEFLQRRYMGKLSGTEVVGHQVLYFHPQDQGLAVLEKYAKKVKLLKRKA